MSEHFSTFYLKHPKKRPQGQLRKWLEAIQTCLPATPRDLKKVNAALNKLKPNASAQDINTLSTIIEQMIALDIQEDNAGFLVFDVQGDSSIEELIGDLLGFIMTTMPEADVRAYMREDGDPCETFYRVEQRQIVCRGFEPYNGEDEITIKHGIYAWWHHDLPASISTGYLYDEEKRNPTLEQYRHIELTLSGKKVVKRHLEALRTQLADSKIYTWDSTMNSVQDIRDCLNRDEYQGFTVFSNRIADIQYHVILETMLHNVWWLRKHDVLKQVRAEDSWLLHFELNRYGSGFDPDTAIGYVTIKGKHKVRMEFPHQGKSISTEFIEQAITMIKELSGLETLVASYGVNPKELKLVHLPKDVATSMLELQVYASWDSYKAIQ